MFFLLDAKITILYLFSMQKLVENLKYSDKDEIKYTDMR